MLIFNGVGGGTVVGNGMVVWCGGGGAKFKNVLLYTRLETYTKVQLYHASSL